MYPKTKKELIERYKTACNLKPSINIGKIEKHVYKNYLALKLKPKKIKMVSSLIEFYTHIKSENVWDATWISFYCIGAYEIKKSDKEIIMNTYYPLFQAMECGLWLFAYLEDCFLCLPMPKVKTINGNHLHCNNGPAFELPDQKLYFLNGVYVGEELVMTPAEKIDPFILLKERNAEIRREIVRKIGIESVIKKLGAELLDKQGEYELLLLDLKDGRKREYLKMLNPSIQTYHIEGVHPTCKTVQEALDFRAGKKHWKPVELT
jgi:hypothetical protein